MKERIQVRLKVDLTEYMKGLVAGTVGYTIGTFGIWSRTSDRFVGVHFPGIGTLDVLWKSLEIIDEDYLREVEEYQKKKYEELKSAKNVVKYIGPRGGFRYFSYEYIDSNGIRMSTSNSYKLESEKLIELFKEFNIPVEIKTIP